MKHSEECEKGRECKKCEITLIILFFSIISLFIGALIIGIGDETLGQQVVTNDLLDDYCKLSYGDYYYFEDVSFGLNNEIGCTNSLVLKYLK